MTIKTLKKRIASSYDVYTLFRHLLDCGDLNDLDKEHFWAIGINGRNTILYVELVSLGILNSSIVHPREVYRFAIMKSVSSIIVAHNHPSGDPMPSPEDINITKRLHEAGKVLGISLLDHVIIGDNTFYSFNDKGAL